MHKAKEITENPFTFIADRFGDWTDEQRAIPFRYRFGDSAPVDQRDPRKPAVEVSGDGKEQQFVALFEDHLGILSEFELTYCRDEETGNAFCDENRERISDVQFKDLVDTYKTRMAIAQAQAPGSYFFVGHGDATFLGHVTLMAFTPFLYRKGLEDPQTVSPQYLEALYEKILQAT